VIHDDDDVQIVPPCRVLMENGKPVNYTIASRQPREDPFIFTPQSRRPSRGKPASKKEKPAPRPGGLGWARRTNITAEAISELMAQGMTPRKIAVKFKCDASTIYNRLRLRPIANQEGAE
jgi:DNA invertase Pin-like site-specific DNA recombinase